MVIHCIKASVLDLTLAKKSVLDHEFNGFQWWMQFGIDKGILSQYKRAKNWYYKKIHYKTYPMIIPKKQVWFRFRKTKLTPYWIKISVSKRRGIGVWLPIKPHKPLPDFRYLKDSLLLKNKFGEYELRLIFDIPTLLIKPQNILAIDLGERTLATVCDSIGNVRFLGRKIRGIRRHFAWLRRKLGQKKLLKIIKKIGHKEKNIVHNLLHHISKEIVEWAKKTKAVIVLGDLKGIRKAARGKRMRRLLHCVPFYKFTKMIEYKSTQAGIQTVRIKEHNTSNTCHKCHAKGKRTSQPSFSCGLCETEYNADLNAAINIGNRAREQGILVRAVAHAQKSAKDLVSPTKVTV
jgi:putative transposase